MPHSDLIDTAYATKIVVVLRTLAFVNATMTYGELAQAIGVWDGKGPFRHNFDIGRLLKKTAKRYPHEALQFERAVNAQTGEPGAGFYAAA
jgi:hypothetical protein